jgi:hypothetical protein
MDQRRGNLNGGKCNPGYKLETRKKQKSAVNGCESPQMNTKRKAWCSLVLHAFLYQI